MIDTVISKRRLIALIYDTYHIVRLDQTLPSSLLTIEGVERLVSERKIPRSAATIIYKIMLEPEPKVNWLNKEEVVEYLKQFKETK